MSTSPSGRPRTPCDACHLIDGRDARMQCRDCPNRESVASQGRSQSSEPTVGFDGQEGVPVTQLPSWHEHPECVYADGRGVLTHGHGFLTAPPPHTHPPVEAWGPMILLPSGDASTGTPS